MGGLKTVYIPDWTSALNGTKATANITNAIGGRMNMGGTNQVTGSIQKTLLAG